MTNTENLNKTLLNIKLKNGDCLCKKMETVSDKIILQDIIHNSIKHIYLIDKINSGQLKKLTKLCAIIMKENYEVPIYLKKYNEFLFWFEKTAEYKYPLNIDCREKFKEYKNYVEQDDLEVLKAKGVVPDWIDDSVDAEKFIWLDFSHTEKKWKENINIFHRTFNNLYLGNENQNSFINFPSLY